MTLTCPECDSVDVDLKRDNGATDGTTTRVEWYRCVHCNHRFKKVLRP